MKAKQKVKYYSQKGLSVVSDVRILVKISCYSLNGEKTNNTIINYSEWQEIIAFSI